MPTKFDPADVHEPAANTAAVVTYAAATGIQHVIKGVAWSYDAAPTGGNLKIEDGSGNTVFSLDVTNGGPGVVDISRRGTTNTALIITLAAGGGTVVGKLSVLDHWTEP